MTDHEEQQEAARRDLDTLMQQLRGYPPARVAAAVWDWMKAQGFRSDPADHEPCDEEKWSWDLFSTEAVDPYWMRCHLVGPHETHENSETGAKWSVKQDGAAQ